MMTLLPRFVTRRYWPLMLAGVATAAWANRADLARWRRFVQRSFRDRKRLDLSSLLTEARLRMAISLDPVLRRDPNLEDVVVDEGRVTVRTVSDAWPDVATHLNALLSVKGVDDLRCEPGRLVGGARLTADGTPVI